MDFRKLAAGACFLSIAAAAQAQSYRVTGEWKIGGTGGWDYLLSDDAAHRLYITHGPRVEVMDSRDGKLLGAITDLKGTHGIALNPDGKTGYISDGGANAIVVFDRDSLKVKQTVAAGTNPDGITYEPVTKTVWAFNGRSKDVSVLDTATNRVVATIALPGKPEFPQADGEGHVFDNIEDKNMIVELDAKTKTVVATWTLEGCDSPSGLAIDRAHHRLFPVCDGNTMAIFDYKAGKQVARATIGGSPDAAGFDAKTQLAFSSNGEGNLSVIDTTKAGFPTLQTVTTVKGARTMALDESTGRVYLAAAQYGPTPAPTAEMPRPRPSIVPDTFRIVVVSR